MKRRKINAGKAFLFLLVGAGLMSSALAQTANVTLYGTLNMSLDAVSSSDSSALKTHRVTSWGGSMFGFRGTESLGNGTNAIFQIESGISGDQGNTALAGRTTYLGLQGNWGTVKLGRATIAIDDLYFIFADNTWRNPVLTNAALWAQGGLNAKNGSFDDTLPNVIRYETPTWNGLRGAVGYSMGEDKNRAYNLSGSLIYKNDKLRAGVAYTYQHDYRHALGDAAASGNNDWATSFAVGYDFGFVTLSGLYEHLEYELNNGNDKLKRDLYGVTATVPIGSFKVFGYYGYADNAKGKESLRVGDIRGGKDTGAQQFTLSVSYPLSKRTVAYAGYMYLKNGARANYTYFRDGNRSTPFGPSNVALGTHQQGAALGMHHFF
ncbi:MAG: porin [Proteobacteria bacterium]|nr:porin [Pseudomonadota bacterium]MCL2307892.1 porin [Pseudomonadota bacterium]